VRSEGSGAFLAGRVSPLAALATGVVAAAIAALAAGLHGVELAACAAATIVVLGAFFARWLGGVTGDTLGATAELAETLALVTAAAVVG
jgi:cobalamin synthase